MRNAVIVSESTELDLVRKDVAMQIEKLGKDWEIVSAETHHVHTGSYGVYHYVMTVALKAPSLSDSLKSS